MPVLAEVFDIEQEQILAQDVSLIRDSVQEIAVRLEGKQLLVATGAGAVAALAGAAIAVLLT